MSEGLARQLATLGIADRRVLDAVAEVDRARFVPPHLRAEADADRPLPIGFGQTISQPFVVAYMTEQLGLGGEERVLEVGTGSGYQAAVLAQAGCRVHSIELLAPLADSARARLATQLALGHFIVAGLIMIVANIFDFIDGKVAHQTGQMSKFGGFWDSVIDRFSDIALFIGLIYLYSSMGRTDYALVASRYMHQHGVTEAGLAELAVLMRRHAGGHPGGGTRLA